MTTVQRIVPTDERLLWSGAISVEQGEGWVMPWRLPHQDLDLFPPEALQNAAATPSGVRLRFGTDAAEIGFAIEAAPQAHCLDLYADDVFVATLPVAEGATAVAYDKLPPGMKTLELWLRPGTPFKLRAIDLPAGASLERSEDARPKWVTYGSSITQCNAAGSPSFTWPGVVARAKGLNLTSLGFGGQCHADPMIARLIRDLPADFISLKLGINIYGNGSLNARSFLPAVLGTIATVREGHPDIPLVVCSPIWSPPRESTPNRVDMTLAIMREYVEHAVERFRVRGDRSIHYVNGLRLFGPELAALLPDELHPDAEGYRRLGENFARVVFEEIGIEV